MHAPQPAPSARIRRPWPRPGEGLHGQTHALGAREGCCRFPLREQRGVGMPPARCALVGRPMQLPARFVHAVEAPSVRILPYGAIVGQRRRPRKRLVHKPLPPRRHGVGNASARRWIHLKPNAPTKNVKARALEEEVPRAPEPRWPRGPRLRTPRAKAGPVGGPGWRGRLAGPTGGPRAPPLAAHTDFAKLHFLPAWGPEDAGPGARGAGGPRGRGDVNMCTCNGHTHDISSVTRLNKYWAGSGRRAWNFMRCGVWSGYTTIMQTCMRFCGPVHEKCLKDQGTYMTGL